MKGVKRKEAIEKTKKEISRKGNQDSGEKMKNRKAVGINGRPMVAWKNAGKDGWNGLVMRGDQNVFKNYRRISLLCTAYKMRREEEGYLEKDMERGSG